MNNPPSLILTLPGAGLSILEMLTAAQSAGSVIAPPMTARVWRKNNNDLLEWEHPDYGTLEVYVQGLSRASIQAEGNTSWGEINMTRQLRKVTARFVAKTQSGVTLMRGIFKCAGESAMDVVASSDIRPLEVDVTWEPPAQDLDPVPQTHNSAEKDAGFIFLNDKGMFVQIEVAIRAYKGKMFLVLQENFCGQVVRTTKEKAVNLNVTTYQHEGFALLVVPLYAENAARGGDYLKTFGPGVLEHALERGVTVPLSRATVAVWQQSVLDIPEEMKRKGWKKATVAFYNPSWKGGAGIAICEEGKGDENPTCFIHALQLLDEDGRPVASRGQFPMFANGCVVALKWRIEDGKRKATAIRKIAA